jgi:hypothetical protein
MTTPESSPSQNIEAARLCDTIARRYNWEHILYPIIFNNTPGASETMARVLEALALGGQTPTQLRALQEFAADHTPDEAIPPPTPEDYNIDPDVLTTLHNWSNGTLQCIDFMNSERQNLTHSHLRKNIDLQWLIVCSGVDKGIAHPAVAHAFTAITNAYMQMGDELDAGWIDNDCGTSPNMLFVSSHKDLSLMRIGLDRQQMVAWIQQHIDDFPRWFAYGMPGFTLSHETPIQNLPNGDVRALLGDYAINTTTQRIRRSIAVYGNHINKSQRATHGLTNREIAGEIATHEIGHFAHFNRVPLVWLRDYWLPAITAEQIDVSEYVASRTNHTDKLREDFCDSLTLYRHEPAELMYKSLGRMQALNALLQRYPDDLITMWGPHIQKIDNSIHRISYKQLFVSRGVKWHARLVASQQPSLSHQTRGAGGSGGI